MHCRRIDPVTSCPELKCPVEEQFSVPDECCNFCPGMFIYKCFYLILIRVCYLLYSFDLGVDYCAKGHECHKDATCLNLKTQYACQCNKGHEGDGRHCEDINECQREGGHDGHHCRENTVCVNLLGDYVCECLPGYKRYDKYICVGEMIFNFQVSVFISYNCFYVQLFSCFRE